MGYNLIFLRLINLSTLVAILTATYSACLAQVFQDSVSGHDYRIEVTFNKTTNLIFNSAIVSVDRGSRDVLAQHASKAENVLQVKAGRKGFEETNLSVITAAGNLYNIIVEYKDNPMFLNWLIGYHYNPTVSFSDEQNAWGPYVNLATGAEQNIASLKTNAYGITLSVTGIYTDGERVIARMKLTNRSPIDYHAKAVNFFVRDIHATKRTAFQQLTIMPLHLRPSGPIEVEHGRSIVIVAVLPKFPMAKVRKLWIEFIEEKGGRLLRLAVPYRVIMRANRF
ncbi:conjugative transposon protein TraN [Pseudochryseolinea flava]|uniref:Conjugative transposon protein TraN n=1 Tax=Pseudochryseolinea flava TaxID=2059302 RepID=A0A364XX91_9BACT|nr:conjugative transposon protein TraN [Pseudochryseolinea flava]RAV98857.1 conjugative transposon protein TraN [Pseudochryseolinea flava]